MANSLADLSTTWVCSMFFNLLECDYTIGSAASDPTVTFDYSYNARYQGSLTTSVLHKIGTDSDGCWNKASGGVLKISGLGMDLSADFATTDATSIEFLLPPASPVPTQNSDLINGADNAMFCFMGYDNNEYCGPTFELY